MRYGLFGTLAKGSGQVKRNDDSHLSIVVHVPAQDVLGFEIDEINISAELVYKAEGASNEAVIAIDDSNYNDQEVKIKSNASKRRRFIDPSEDFDGKDVYFHVRSRGQGRAEISGMSGLPKPIPSGIEVRVLQQDHKDWFGTKLS